MPMSAFNLLQHGMPFGKKDLPSDKIVKQQKVSAFISYFGQQASTWLRFVSSSNVCICICAECTIVDCFLSSVCRKSLFAERLDALVQPCCCLMLSSSIVIAEAPEWNQIRASDAKIRKCYSGRVLQRSVGRGGNRLLSLLHGETQCRAKKGGRHTEIVSEEKWHWHEIQLIEHANEQPLNKCLTFQTDDTVRCHIANGLCITFGTFVHRKLLFDWSAVARGLNNLKKKERAVHQATTRRTFSWAMNTLAFHQKSEKRTKEHRTDYHLIERETQCFAVDTIVILQMMCK